MPKPRAIDVFPARVTIESPGGNVTYTRARVRTIHDIVEVWIEDTEFPHPVKLAFTADVDDIIESTIGTSMAIRNQHATMVAGSTAIAIQRENGCGCGSKLRTDLPRAGELSRNAVMQAIYNNWPQLYPDQQTMAG